MAADGSIRAWGDGRYGGNGAPFGTGFTAIEIAKALGTTHVVTVTSAEHIAWVESLGADEVYDYHNGDVFSHLADNSVDFVYDNYGAKGAAAKAMRVLRPGGWLVYLAGKDGGLCHRPSCTPKAGVKHRMPPKLGGGVAQALQAMVRRVVKKSH